MVAFGIAIFPTDKAIQPAELACAVEERGFESLFFPEHTHIPTSRKSPWPGGDELPEQYWRSHDPLIALAAAAAVTQRIRLGTAILLMPQRDPIITAKQIASLDMISNGRVVLGIGGGWNAEEMGDHGVRFADRWKVVRERVLAMKAIWTQDEAEFHGEFVNFDPIWCWPKPVQPGGPPILLGAGTKWGMQRVVEYCDGWIPLSGRSDPAEGLAQLREAAAAVGRTMDTLQLTMAGMGRSEERVQQAIDLGFQRLIFQLPPDPTEQAIQRLDQYAEIAQRYGG